MPARRAALAAAVCLGLVAQPMPALAWGSHGHRIVGRVAMEALPAEVPAFLRTPAAAGDVGELSREPDRSKGAGRTHGLNRDPAHFVDIDGAGKVLGGPPFRPLPLARPDYEKQLQAAGLDSWKAGYLQFSLVEEWQQLAKDFAYWRVLEAAQTRTDDPGRRAWYAEDIRRREALILQTIGRLSHWAADGSQPLHVSVHFNGWGDYPNPKGYTTARIHGLFESDFVRANVEEDQVRAAMAPFKACDCPIDERVMRYLEASVEQVEPLYALEKVAGFDDADPRVEAFAVERLGVGANELRDLVVEAWRASASGEVGWRPVKVADVLAGRVDPFDALYSVD